MPEDPEEHLLDCPQCGSSMRLKASRYGLFYGCSRWPACDATHGAHPNGEPLGVPADKETKRWRILAHEAFDQLWKGPTACMDRSAAYRWMTTTLAMSADEAHIARFSREQCMRLIEALRNKAIIDTMNSDPHLETILQRRAAKRRRKQSNRRKYHGS